MVKLFHVYDTATEIISIGGQHFDSISDVQRAVTKELNCPTRGLPERNPETIQLQAAFLHKSCTMATPPALSTSVTCSVAFPAFNQGQARGESSNPFLSMNFFLCAGKLPCSFCNSSIKAILVFSDNASLEI